MSPDHPESSHETSAPPAAGRNGRLGLNDLNLGFSNKCDGRTGLWQRFLRGFSQFLAGMYTGESCAGTPHGERTDNTSARPRRGPQR